MALLLQIEARIEAPRSPRKELGLIFDSLTNSAASHGEYARCCGSTNRSNS